MSAAPPPDGRIAFQLISICISTIAIVKIKKENLANSFFIIQIINLISQCFPIIDAFSNYNPRISDKTRLLLPLIGEIFDILMVFGILYIASASLSVFAVFLNPNWKARLPVLKGTIFIFCFILFMPGLVICILLWTGTLSMTGFAFYCDLINYSNAIIAVVTIIIDSFFNFWVISQIHKMKAGSSGHDISSPGLTKQLIETKRMAIILICVSVMGVVSDGLGDYFSDPETVSVVQDFAVATIGFHTVMQMLFFLRLKDLIRRTSNSKAQEGNEFLTTVGAEGKGSRFAATTRLAVRVPTLPSPSKVVKTVVTISNASNPALNVDSVAEIDL